MTAASPQIKSPKTQLLHARKHEAKLNRLRKQAVNLGNHIKQHFSHTYGIELPEYRMVYNQSKPLVYQVNTNTGELYDYESTVDRLDNLAKLYYVLTGTQYSLGGMFISKTGTIQTQTICHTYTRNRVDPLWNSKKSQLIRNIYYHYINEGLESGELKDKTPIHLVLTVPHKDGMYKGQNFYGKIIVSDFNKLRKNNAFWYGAVYGGEYGVETKKSSKGNGLHIHTHSFTLLFKNFNPEAIPARGQFRAQMVELIREFEDNPLLSFPAKEYTIKAVKQHLINLCESKPQAVSLKWFQNKMYHAWYALTDAKQLWVEHLYTFQRDKDGKRMFEYKEKETGIYYDSEETAELYKAKRGENYMRLPVKKPVDVANPEDYTAGIMECIKYHFKGDAFQDDGGNYWDCELIADTLNETKGMRLYSRFAAFYKKPELSFNKRVGDNDKTEAEPVGGEIKNIINKLVNPYTEQYASLGQTILCVFKPEQRSYFNTDVDIWKEKQKGFLPKEGGDNPERKNLSYERDSTLFVAVDENLPLKYIVKEMVLKRTSYLSDNIHNTAFQSWYKIISQLWGHIRVHQDDYNKFVGIQNNWQEVYDARDSIGKLTLIVDTMRAYLQSRMQIATGLAFNDDGNPLLTAIEPLNTQTQIAA